MRIVSAPVWSTTTRAFVAFCLSLVLPGSGSFYLGRLPTAIAVLTLATLGSLLAALAWNLGVLGAFGLVVSISLVTLAAHLGGAICAACEATSSLVKRGFVATLLFMLCSAFGMMGMQQISRKWVMAVYTVTTIGMEPSLHFGDRVLAKPVLPSTLLQRGELIAVQDPDSETAYVRRIVGLPGDHVHIVDADVWVNGHLLREAACAPELAGCFVEQSSDGLRYPVINALVNGKIDLEVTVAADKLFLLRDRRDLSIPMDPVERSWVRGQVMDVWWSYDGQKVEWQRIGQHVAAQSEHR